MSIRFIVYVSKLVDPKGPGAVAEIIRTARAHNAIHGVTGALIFDGERFCQCIEGTEDEIAQLYAAIERDERHAEIRKVGSGALGQRRFDGWSMAYVYASTPGLIARLEEQSSTSVGNAFAVALALCDVEV